MQEQCPICKINADSAFIAKDWNMKVSAEAFKYLKCRKCGLIFLANPPVNLGAYYEDSYYRQPLFKTIKKVAKKSSYQLAMIKKFVKGGRLLEVGPGFGTFSLQAKKGGFEVDVIERGEKCCDFLSESVGVRVIKSDQPHKAIETAKEYDVIALWQVIEHLPNPWEFLSKAAKKLRSNGVMVIATPSPSAFQFRLLKEKWPHVDAPRHLWLFPVELLIDYLVPLGLEPVMVTFDDKGARSWNRFGWQRYLMNYFNNKQVQRLAYILGYLIYLPMGIFDRQNGRGSSYTVIFQKKSGVVQGG